MQVIFGKIVGGLFGLMLGAILGNGWAGGLIGVWLGHRFDVGLSRVFEQGGVWQFGFNQSHSSAQQVFFDVTFSVMGHLAKADGVISEKEIAVAQRMMQQLNLGLVARKAAIEAFQRGKQPDFDCDAACQRLRQMCGRNPVLLKLFLECQMQAAMADGPMQGAKKIVFERICAQLGVAMSAGGNTHYQYSSHQHSQHVSSPSAADYQLLGIDAHASDVALKKAYRRQMAAHHPDRLVAKGLPEEMIQVATQKTQAIQAAYKRIKSARGL